MEKPAEPATSIEGKHSINWGFILWPLVILILYVLSFGPIMLMMDKGRISSNSKLEQKIYKPWFWAYHNTPLHKPMGMYLHLWTPHLFDKDGRAMMPPGLK